MNEQDYFEGVVGQELAKRELAYRLKNHHETQMPFPHMLLTGSKGDGKSHLARKIGKNLPDFGDGSRQYKKFYSLNASSIKNLRTFFEDICSQFADGDQYCTIFIDEAHELPKPVQNALLTVLENTPVNRTTYEYDDIPYYFDFHKVTFVFATTEDDKIIEPLVDRLMKISLEPYTEKELAQIITGVVDGAVDFEDGVLEKLSKHVRRNARKADQLAKDVLSAGATLFTENHFNELALKTNLAPLGLEIPEIRMLRILDEAGAEGLSLGMLSSKLARPAKATQKGLEPYPLALGLMAIDGRRMITGKGKEYLKALDGKKTLDGDEII